MPTALQETIARAIKSADRSWFNEDYVQQAQAVIVALRKAGYEIVPTEPPEALVEHACANLPLGRLRQQDSVRALYTLMVTSSRRFSF